MASSQNTEFEFAKLLHKLIQESSDEPAILASRLIKILRFMKLSGTNDSMSLAHQVISRAMETLINELGLDIEAPWVRCLHLTRGTETGSSCEMSKGGPLAPRKPPIGPSITNHNYYLGPATHRSGQSFDQERPSSLDSRSANSQSQENHGSANWDEQLNVKDGKKGTKKRKKVDTLVVELPRDNTHQLNMCNPLVSTIAIDEDGPTHKWKSVVWNHFRKEKINDAMKAICNYCGKKLGGESKNGTKHLHHHLKVCSSRKERDMRQSSFQSGKANDGNVVLNAYTSDSEVSRRDLASMIILHDYPLAMVEHRGFRKFVNSVQPLFKFVMRSTVQKDIFMIYKEERSKTMKMLESNQSRIAITTDMWTDVNQKKEYMTITAHFIDESWNLQSRIIRFACVPCPYTTADTHFDVLMSCLLDWNIDRKLSTLTVDGTNVAMVQKLLDKLDLRTLLLHGDLFHMSCCAYILNFIANEGLVAIGESIERIRDRVAYWTATPKRLERFQAAARYLQIPGMEDLVCDSTTKWTSTFLMLKSALRYENVFPHLRQHEIQYKPLPLKKDWIFAREMCDKLEVFYYMTRSLSKTKYPTLSMVFSEICDIRLELSKWVSSEIDEVRVIAPRMVGIFEVHWGLIRGCLTIATVLDPRFKMRLIEFYFSQIYEHHCYLEIERVRNLCEELVKCYTSNSSITVEWSNSSFSSRRQDVDNFVQKKDRFLKFDEFVSNTGSSIESAKAELDIYLRESLVQRSDNFDILTWWKLNGTKYPTLFQIAKDVLAIPVSTIASKLAFGPGGRKISPQRSNLHPKLLEALMCTQDWLWAKETPDDRGSASLSADVDLD